MKNTGMIRRIDDLGRIVIPKEIRNSMGIKVGNALEISVNGDDIVLSKRNMITTINDYAQELCDTASDVLGLPIIICDKEHVIAVSGCSQKMYLHKNITNELKAAMLKYDKFEGVAHEHNLVIPIICDDNTYVDQCIYPIMADIVCEGLVIGVSNSGKLDASVTNTIKLVATYLTKQLG